ncbi:MAG: CvpA family protein [Neisseria sp.]|nr:CvpA family protein [Neisseria sp.]
MTLFDIFMVCVIGLSVALSFMRGVVAEVISLFTWIAAVVAARFLAAPIGGAFLTSIRPPALATVAGFILTFAGVWLVMILLRSVLTSGVEALGLGGVNRFLGGVFGFLRGCAIMVLVVLVCSFTDMPQSDDWKNSYGAAFFEGAASVAVPYLPDYLAEKVRYRSSF